MIHNRILETILTSWEDIQELQPSNLKNSKEYRESLKGLIRKHGFAKAFDGWRDKNDVVWMIDGHQRKEALRELIQEGETIQDLLPVTLIDAKNRKDAIKILIDVHNTKQSEMNEAVLIEFLETEEIETEEVEMSEVRTKFEYNEVDYSDKNKEIDLNDFEDKMTLVLNYTLDEYELVKSQLMKHGNTPEDAVCNLLGIKDNFPL